MANGFQGQAGQKVPEMTPEIVAGITDRYIEAFANLYRDFAAVVRGEERALLPGIQDGLRSMTFVETAIAACRGGKAWVDLEI